MCDAGRERELASTLKLVTTAVQNYPSVVCDDKCSAALAMLQRIIPMFAQEKFRQERAGRSGGMSHPSHSSPVAAVFRNVHNALLGAIVSLVSLLPGGSMPVHTAVCRGIAELAEGLLHLDTTAQMLCLPSCMEADSQTLLSLQMHMER